MILQEVFASLIGALDEHITIQKATTRNGRGIYFIIPQTVESFKLLIICGRNTV